MIVKSQAELAHIIKGAGLLKDILNQVISEARVGGTGLELSNRAEQLILDAGATPAFKGYGIPPYPHALCVSINDCVVHGIPTGEPFKKGDIVGLDIGLIWNGYYTDMARTIFFSPLSEREMQLITCTKQSLEEAIRIIKPGVTTGDIGYAVQTYVESQGFGVVRDLAGHGIGRALHESPEIPNFGTQGSGSVLKEGSIIAIEPMITLGDWSVSTADDQWSILTQDHSKTAHFEDMIAVTKDGYRILTR